MNKLTYRVIPSIALAVIILFTLGGVAAPVQAGGGSYVAPISPDGGGGIAPTAISPDGATESITPTFVWTVVPNATQYEVFIDKGSKTFYITYVNSYVCGSTLCQFTPAKKFANGVEYAWTVRAEVANVYQGWSSFAFFTVYQPFSSSFANSKGWAPVYGTWAAHGGDYIGSHSTTTLLYMASAYYTKGQYDTYTYEARMKLVCSDNCQAEMYFNGNPFSGRDTYGDWNNTYYFDYTNSGDYFIEEVKGGSYWDFQSGPSSMINTSSWNILTVTYNASTGYAQFFINHVLVGDATMTDFPYGYVGVGLYSDLSSDSLDVDYANLTAGAPDSQVGSGVTRAANFVHFTGKPVATGNAR
ncbi:MAG: hypothetical protein WCE68_12595 [Anaerolineales bacterium]